MTRACALAAGCAAAFARRLGKALTPLGTQPDITGADLLDVAERIVARVGLEVPVDGSEC